MSIERILADRELVEDIARQLDAEHGLSGRQLREAADAVRDGRESQLSAQEEAIIRRLGRPVFFIRDNQIVDLAGVWRDRIEPTRQQLQARFPSIGRIEVARHPKLTWAGTGWLIAPDVIITNRHVVRLLGSTVDGRFVLDVDPYGDPVQLSVDFVREHQSQTCRVFDVVRVLHVEEGPDRPDVALLKIARTGTQDEAQAEPIGLADRDPPPGSAVAAVGYAAWDGARNPEDVMFQIFKNIYDVKRLHPGEVLGANRYLEHDCSTLGGNSGSTVLDVATGCAVGLHFAGDYERKNFAVKSSALQEILHRQRILGAG